MTLAGLITIASKILPTCHHCGDGTYMRHYHHLTDGEIIRCIWCGYTDGAEERAKKYLPQSAMENKAFGKWVG